MSGDGPRIETIFREVVDLRPGERERVLRERCGEDADLLRRVRRLIEADALRTNPLLAAALDADEPETLGPYRIVRLLGEGGMGAVHLAEQTEPVRRLVALKRIRPGAHRETTQARFEAERQILAQLDHPGIARVYDAGTSPAGLPWFAMEYVEGLPLLEACERSGAGLAERLRLFLEVCAAVQHAHGKGVIHCDLSPRNVLVKEIDGVARAKVIDFGIARVLTVTPLPSGELATERPVGTRLAMSPEQADPSGPALDTRTDVYSLGALLYELLAGRPPFDPERLAALDAEEAGRFLREEEPPPPSRHVASLAGDLDWIVARAMARERDGRYSTVAELALDLRRYLAHEPVSAAPGDVAYLVRKFVRRHVAGVVAAGLVVVSLVTGLVAVDAARRRASEAEARAERKRAILEREREEAEAIRTLIQHVLYHVGGSREDGGAALDAHDLLELAAQDAATLFRGRPTSEAAARHVLGQAFLALAAAQRAKEELLAAYALGQEGAGDDPADVLGVLESLVVATRRADGIEAAGKWVQRTLEVGARALDRSDPELLASLDPLVRLLAGEDVPDPALAQAFDTLEARLAGMSLADPLLRPLARLLAEAGETFRSRGGARASSTLEVIADLGRQLLPENDLRCSDLLLSVAQDELRAQDARPRVAEELALEVLEHTGSRLNPDHWLRVEALATLGAAYLAGGDEAAAESALLEARALAAGVERRTAVHERAAGCLRELGETLSGSGYDEARRTAFLRASFERWRDSGGATGWWPVTWPEVPAALRSRAVGLLTEEDLAPAQRARGLVRMGRAEEALEGLTAEDPETLAFRALALEDLGRRDEAARALEEAERAAQEPAAEVSAAWPVLRAEAHGR